MPHTYGGGAQTFSELLLRPLHRPRTVEGGGHVPPSAVYPVRPLWERLVGPQNHDLEGADAFWAFLSRHSRAGS